MRQVKCARTIAGEARISCDARVIDWGKSGMKKSKKYTHHRDGGEKKSKLLCSSVFQHYSEIPFVELWSIIMFKC
jgi:hypothetical protein